MTNRQQWTFITGIVMTVVFGVALALKLRPQLELVEVGGTAPSFHATDLRSGRPISLADYRGHVILLNVWATWCPPCRVEMPSMERLHQKLAGTDFRPTLEARSARRPTTDGSIRLLAARCSSIRW